MFLERSISLWVIGLKQCVYYFGSYSQKKEQFVPYWHQSVSAFKFNWILDFPHHVFFPLYYFCMKINFSFLSPKEEEINLKEQILKLNFFMDEILLNWKL